MHAPCLVLWATLISITGCSRSMPYDQLDATRANAINALNIAQSAKEALDDGSASGTTMGDEIEEAKNQAANAEDIATQAFIKASEQEERIDTICARAPNLCY